MPELPEVEITTRRLAGAVINQTIVGTTVNWKRMTGGLTGSRYTAQLKGCTICSVERRAKYIIIGLAGKAGKRDLLCHLRMSGRLEVHPAATPRSSYDRVVLSLSGGCEIRFQDVRKFGRMELVDSAVPLLAHLGPEPADLTLQYLLTTISGKRTRLKPLLLNQSFVAGLGNIYVDECLWRAGIHPERIAATLDPKELKKLHSAIQKVIAEAIDKQGTDFGDGVVPGGAYSPKVYGRTGLKCKRCSDIVVRTVVGQRGTHLCPTCQVRQ